MNVQSNHPSAQLIPVAALRDGVEKLFAYRFEQASVRTPLADRQALINRNYATFQAQVDAGLGDWNRVHPYDIADWGAVLTEVEFGAWQDIRSAGRMPLWPRVPVEDMVISFGNPVAKVALLCSAESETIDPKTVDQARGLSELGWFVVTVTATQCLCVIEAPEDLLARLGAIPDGYAERYRTETLRGAMVALRARFGSEL
ncbi:hypothetical protein [Caballeronia sp. dw_19]|uniref:hypothetical protein n=1 Tax=Caballeronia sp. dw_19 TaxID=2719791 RepID=UPI001BD4EE0F|nr:hypothetical protein [Caballeronia sp. dw_19]